MKLEEMARENRGKKEKLEQEVLQFVQKVQKDPDAYADRVFLNQGRSSCWIEEKVPIELHGPIAFSVRNEEVCVNVFARPVKQGTRVTLSLKGKLGSYYVFRYHDNGKAVIDNLFDRVKELDLEKLSENEWLPAESLVPGFFSRIYRPGMPQCVGKDRDSFYLSALSELAEVSRTIGKKKIKIKIQDIHGELFLNISAKTLDATRSISEDEKELIQSLLEGAEWIEGMYDDISALIPDRNDIDLMTKIPLFFSETDKTAIVNRSMYIAENQWIAFLEVCVCNKVQPSESV